MVYARAQVIVFAEITMVFLGIGCKSSEYFTASSLPMELTANPLQSAQTVDLSRFAGSCVADNTIAEGDMLGISLAAGLSSEQIVDFDVRAGENGETLLPEIGRLPLGGLDAEGAEKIIAAACINRGLYRHPYVTVRIKEQRKNRVTVVGAVKNPGVHELPRGSSNLMTAILAAGGIEENAGTKIDIRRPGIAPSILAAGTAGSEGKLNAQFTIRQPESAVTLAAAESSGSEVLNLMQTVHTEPAGARGVEMICFNLADANEKTVGQTELSDGSIVTVERLQPDPVKVIGLVRKPGQYEYPVTHEIRLLDAIAEAGGVSSNPADKVIVIRKLPDGTGFTGIAASLRKAKRNPAENLRLAPGDVVSVEQSLATAMADAFNFVRFGIGASVPLF